MALRAHPIDTDFGVEISYRRHLIVSNHQVDTVVHKAAQQALNLCKGLNASQVFSIYVDDLVTQAKATIPIE